MPVSTDTVFSSMCPIVFGAIIEKEIKEQDQPDDFQPAVVNFIFDYTKMKVLIRYKRLNKDKDFVVFLEDNAGEGYSEFISYAKLKIEQQVERLEKIDFVRSLITRTVNDQERYDYDITTTVYFVNKDGKKDVQEVGF